MNNLSLKRLRGRMRALLFVPLITVPLAVAVTSKTHYFEVPDEGETTLVAKLDLALGTVHVGKAESGFLFQAEVTLETEQLRPHFEYKREGRTGHLQVELESKKNGPRSFPSLSAAKKSSWNLLFGDRAPLDLDLELGAAKGEFDFTGLPVEHLRLDTGASSSEVVFRTPNPVEMETLTVSAGASSLRIEGLNYTRARYMRFEGGVGSYHLDFSEGTPLADGRAEISIGMAALTVVLPRDEAIVLNAPENWLCSVNVPDNFTKKGKGVWYSRGVQDLDRAFRVHVEAGMGKVNFEYR